jgi:hypothetical protein
MTQAAQTSTPTTAWRLEVPPFVRCRPDASLAQKVDSKPRFGRPCASRPCGIGNLRKNRCILVIAPLGGSPVIEPRSVSWQGQFQDNGGDNRVRVSRDVVDTWISRRG